MDRDVLLKKNIIGGFDKKQVMDYVSHLQASCNNRKTREEIEDMRLRIASLREIIKEKDRQIAALTSEFDDINNVRLPGSDNGSGFDMLKVSAEQVEKAKLEGEVITSKVSEGIKSKEDKFSTLASRISSINDEISKFSESISGLSEKLEDVPFAPVTEKDVDSPEMPKFDFDKVMEAIAEEEAQLAAEAEARAKAEYEERKRIEAEIRAKLEAEAAEKAKLEAEAKAKAEAERARLAAEAKAKAEAEAKAKAEAEKVKLEAEAKAKEIAEEKAKLEAEAAELAKTKTDAQDEKFNTLFARLTAMTDEINKMHGSISDVSEKLSKMPENNAPSSDENPEADDKPEEVPVPEAPISDEKVTAADSDAEDDNLYDDMFSEIEAVISGMSAGDELIKTAVDNAAEKTSPKSDTSVVTESTVKEPVPASEPVTAPSEPVAPIVDSPVVKEPEEQTIQIAVEPQEEPKPVSENLPTQAEIIAEEEKKIEKIRAEKERLEKALAEKKSQAAPAKKNENKASGDSSDGGVEEELYFTFEL